MTEEPEGAHRRRRRRATSAQGAPAAQSAPAAQTAPEPANTEPTRASAPASQAPARAAGAANRPARRPRQGRDTGDGGMRDLVGAGHSQLGVSGALRGRDVNRPSDEDLAEAQENLVIVRRHWQPNPDNGADRK